MKKTNTAHVRPQGGMTLVELMVGLAVSLFLLTVMGAIFVGSRSTFNSQESGSRLQENGRYLIDTLASDVRMSGFRGCLSTLPADSPVDNTLNSGTTVIYNFGEPIWGSHYTGTAWTPALTAPLTGLSANSAGDVLVVRRTVGTGWSLVGEMSSTSGTLPITVNPAFLKGDLLMVADCAGAAVLQATNANPGTSGTIAHTVAGGGTPGVARDALARVFSNDAQVWRMQTLVYYLADSQRHTGQKALWVYANPTYGRAQTSELVSGVDGFRVTYGVDSDGNFSADRFATADAVTNWAQVVSARVELLLVGSAEGKATAAQPYVWAGVSVTPTDNKLRTVVSTLVSLRNSVP
jgi:type IV pilus assembly protein PilW